jgi:hypothetical protein
MEEPPCRHISVPRGTPQLLVDQCRSRRSEDLGIPTFGYIIPHDCPYWDLQFGVVLCDPRTGSVNAITGNVTIPRVRFYPLREKDRKVDWAFDSSRLSVGFSNPG